MEVLERSWKAAATIAIIFIIFWSQCRSVEGHRNTTKMYYVCPPQFIRLGHSCYFFSETKATWQNALFSCKDRDSNLTVPARWEDRNLRSYLNKPDVARAGRWIGGIYDLSSRAWKWGGELRQMRYQSFSKMKKMTPEQLQWHCIAMMPELLYRWAPRSCVEPRQYVCQTKLRKVPKAQLREYRRRWQRMGRINEITAPSVSAELLPDPRLNDVTANPLSLSPKSYDLRPNELRKRDRPTARRRLTPPFPGYSWNRRDPEASYRYNEELLRSGRTGLSSQQIAHHLRRLRRVRDKQLARRKRLRETKGDWLDNSPRRPLASVKTHTYTLDNNISALHPKTIVEVFDMPQPPAPVVTVPRPVRTVG